MTLHNFIYASKTEVLFTSKKELAKSAEYIEFLLCYAEVPGKYIKGDNKLILVSLLLVCIQMKFHDFSDFENLFLIVMIKGTSICDIEKISEINKSR